VIFCSNNISDTYCWMYSTFEIPSGYQGQCNSGDAEGISGLSIYNSYYQWVPLYLLTSAVFFYIPRYHLSFLSHPWTWAEMSNQLSVGVSEYTQLLTKCCMIVWSFKKFSLPDLVLMWSKIIQFCKIPNLIYLQGSMATFRRGFMKYFGKGTRHRNIENVEETKDRLIRYFKKRVSNK